MFFSKAIKKILTYQEVIFKVLSQDTTAPLSTLTMPRPGVHVRFHFDSNTKPHARLSIAKDSVWYGSLREGKPHARLSIAKDSVWYRSPREGKPHAKSPGEGDRLKLTLIPEKQGSSVSSKHQSIFQSIKVYDQTNILQYESQ